MNGDISRFRHLDPDKQYSSVRYQQGRGELDADKNEETEIRLADARTTASHVIGPEGAPAETPLAMQITAEGGRLFIGPGHYYVNGIRVEQRARNAAGERVSVRFEEQPFGVGDRAFPSPLLPGNHIAYLDVWERPVNAIQDPAIREVALGGPDTTTRTEVVWQVKLLHVEDAAPRCGTPFTAWNTLIAGSTGRLRVREQRPADPTRPCDVPETAGFVGLENQMYRVEVHRLEDETPIFKWSRDNGAVVASWVTYEELTLELAVDRLGPGGVTGFEIGQWVEATNDDNGLLRQPGVLGRIADIRGTTLELVDEFPVHPDQLFGRFVPAKHPMVRRWDGVGTASFSADPEGGWLELEDGVQVKFEPGSYAPGDFWIVPARTAELPGAGGRRIEWPQDGGLPAALTPHGPRHHYARLGVVNLAGGAWTVSVVNGLTQDCRPIFPPLAGQLTVTPAGGDGQHGRPGHWLPAPLRVAVMRGARPVEGALIQLTQDGRPDLGVGLFTTLMPNPNGTLATGATTGSGTLRITTNGNGVAEAWWRLGPAPAADPPTDTFPRERAQVARARLLGPNGDMPPELHFVGIAEEAAVIPDAIHVTGMRLEPFRAGAAGVPDLHDGTTFLSHLFNSEIVVELDRMPDTAAVFPSRATPPPRTSDPENSPTIIVTLEAREEDLGGSAGPGLSVAVVLNGTIDLQPSPTAGRALLRWRASPGVLEGTFAGRLANHPARVRVRIKGSQLWAHTADARRLYLDGQLFGVPAPEPRRIRALYPSGVSLRASDFEAWFYLAPRTGTITVGPPAVDFPITAVGSVVPERRTVTVENTTGSNSGTITLAVGGTHQADFSVAAFPCPGGVAPEGNCLIEVAFRPTAAGARTGRLTVTTATGLRFDVVLTGTGVVAPPLRLEPPGVEFGTAPTTGAGPLRPIMLFYPLTVPGGPGGGGGPTGPDPGPGLPPPPPPVTIADVTIGGDDAASFELRENLCRGQTLSPGGSCQSLVEFHPRTPGRKTARLEIRVGGAVVAMAILTGTGV